MFRVKRWPLQTRRSLGTSAGSSFRRCATPWPSQAAQRPPSVLNENRPGDSRGCLLRWFPRTGGGWYPRSDIRAGQGEASCRWGSWSTSTHGDPFRTMQCVQNCGFPLLLPRMRATPDAHIQRQRRFARARNSGQRDEAPQRQIQSRSCRFMQLTTFHAQQRSCLAAAPDHGRRGASGCCMGSRRQRLSRSRRTQLCHGSCSHHATAASTAPVRDPAHVRRALWSLHRAPPTTSVLRPWPSSSMHRAAAGCRADAGRCGVHRAHSTRRADRAQLRGQAQSLRFAPESVGITHDPATDTPGRPLSRNCSRPLISLSRSAAMACSRSEFSACRGTCPVSVTERARDRRWSCHGTSGERKGMAGDPRSSCRWLPWSSQADSSPVCSASNSLVRRRCRNSCRTSPLRCV